MSGKPYDNLNTYVADRAKHLISRKRDKRYQQGVRDLWHYLIAWSALSPCDRSREAKEIREKNE
uniref:Uncharacterized protein n=1 Tax=viral metagenome TaxID=1070528 RepID=A0A6H1ZIL6_9ZZZZ